MVWESEWLGTALSYLAVREMLRGCTNITGKLHTQVKRAEVRLSGYLLVILALGTAFLGGAQSMWARRIEGIYRIAVVLAYWIGLPAIGLGMLLRIR